MAEKHFQSALQRTKKFEGGWSDHPDDRGGKTKYGITEHVWYDYNNGKPPYGIEDITVSDAEEIYFHNYWKRVGCDKLSANSRVPQRVLSEVFDCAVNQGVHRAGEFLQQAYNTLRVGDDFLVVDGIVGPKTCAFIQGFCKKSAYATALTVEIRALRRDHYKSLAAKVPSQKKFLRGWLKRLM